MAFAIAFFALSGGVGGGERGGRKRMMAHVASRTAGGPHGCGRTYLG